MLLCQYGSDAETVSRCQGALRSTIREWQVYQSLKEREKYYRLYAEDKLSKPGFWLLTTAIATASSETLYLTGHNVMGIDSVNLKLGRDSEISLTWSF